jgi:hypothetical protein
VDGMTSFVLGTDTMRDTRSSALWFASGPVTASAPGGWKGEHALTFLCESLGSLCHT